MKRRNFIALTGGAVAWPFVARAQQPEAPLVGFLHVASAKGLLHIIEAVRQGAKEANPSGATITIESRWAEGRNDRLAALAAELIERRVSAIVTGGLAASLAAKAATATIPIVFINGGDPVTDGLVSSLSRPGGNVTGMCFMALGPKRLELMRELVPQAALIALFVNPDNPTLGPELQEMETAANAMGQKLLVLEAGTPQAIDAAFVTLVQRRAGALLITVDANFNARRDQLVALAAKHAVPAMYYAREFAASGGLVSYGPNITEIYRQVGGYVARILAGANPAELPVLQPTKFDLVINTKAAKALGLTIPRLLLARANQVIE